jgi:hypothetical protein
LRTPCHCFGPYFTAGEEKAVKAEQDFSVWLYRIDFHGPVIKSLLTNAAAAFSSNGI